MGRLAMLLFVGGAAGAHLFAELPVYSGMAAWIAGACVAISGAALTRRSWRRGAAGWAVRGCLLLAVASLGMSSTLWRAESRQADTLALEHENLVTRLVLDVVGLPSGDAQGQRFAARVVHSPVAGVPTHLMVGWYAAPYAPPGDAARAPGIDVRPGQRYSAAVVLRRPHTAMNPHAFDAEAWMFERGLRANATVRGAPVLLEDDPWRDAGVAVQRSRHALREALRPSLEGRRWGPLVLALALGDQAGVAREDWDLFNRSGITHLVSISGMHVTLLSGLAGALVLRGYPRVRWRRRSLAERWPAQLPAAGVAVLVALGYSLLAGWGVPAQRTFLMLATVATAVMLRLPMSASRVLVLALFIVTLRDPWSPLSPGFWLSFGAVAVLLLLGTGRWRMPDRRRWARALRESTRLQMAITGALIPALALQFHSVSLVSPLANAIAIPVVSFVATPLSVLGMLLAPVGWVGGGLAQAAEWVLGLMMLPVTWLADQRGAVVMVAAPPWPWVALSVAAVVYALLPPGIPGRAAAWLLVVPVMFYTPPRPATGGWRLAALDVGQGSALVIETARHVVVFDTGPPLGPGNDAGERTVWPYLRARGIRHIDDLVVSHADADHVGGLGSLLSRLSVSRLRTSWHMHEDTPWAACRTGTGWSVDGVSFRFLHPITPARPQAASAERNAASCVLQIQGLHHAALLPGDIGQAQESGIAATGSAAADVVLMAHHGSLSSSAPGFVAATGAAHAIAQAGFLSRFNHPRPEVVSRWAAAGARTHRTDHDGAIIVTSSAAGLDVVRQRDAARRYWHRRD